jgi:hypothetical protein
LHAIGTQCPPSLHQYRPGGELTKATSPESADVQLGSPETVLAVSCTLYAPLDGWGAASSTVVQPAPLEKAKQPMDPAKSDQREIWRRDLFMACSSALRSGGSPRDPWT